MSDHELSNPKLSRRLKRALLATLLAVLVLATLAAAVSAYLEASDIQDETLLSVARLVESNQIVARSGELPQNKEHLDDGAVSVWEVGRTSRDGVSISKRRKPGFHTLRKDDEFWRVYVTQADNSGKHYAIAQQLSVSAELAFKSAVNTAVPLLLLFLLVPLLVTIVVKHSFKPLNALAREMGGSDSLKLELDSKKDIPLEVLPFISAIDALLEKNEAYTVRQRRFIADAAHELRTPITALSLEVENVQSASTESVRLTRQTKLSNSVARLQRLLNQLLDLARVQSIAEQSKNIVDFDDVVRTQVAELVLLAEDKGVDICVNRIESVQVVDINNQLQHLIRNALSNAIKFAQNDGDVEISLYREKSLAIFRVSDDGPGVNEEHLGNLHEPFYRPEGQVSGNGAGLGLAICHEIAGHLNGTLTFENRDPTGFLFTYCQPVV